MAHLLFWLLLSSFACSSASDDTAEELFPVERRPLTICRLGAVRRQDLLSSDAPEMMSRRASIANDFRTFVCPGYLRHYRQCHFVLAALSHSKYSWMLLFAHIATLALACHARMLIGTLPKAPSIIAGTAPTPVAAR